VLIFLCGLYINSTTFFRLRLAEHYVKARRYGQAVNVYKKIIRKEGAFYKDKALNEGRIKEMRLFLLDLLPKARKFSEAALAIKNAIKTGINNNITIIHDFEDKEDYRRFGIALAQEGLYDMAAAQFKKAVSHYPEDENLAYQNDMLHNKDGIDMGGKGHYLTPMYKVNYSFPGGSTLLGYSFDKREFELFNEGSFDFFWLTKSKDPARCYHETVSVKNITPNFGFEVDVPGEAFPAGWMASIYNGKAIFKKDSNAYSIIANEDVSHRTQYLAMSNLPSKYSNRTSSYISVNPNSFYLLSASIGGNKGKGYVKITWFDNKKNPIKSTYLLRHIKLPQWKKYSRITVSPMKSSFCRLLLTNYNAIGETYFDDILFTEICPQTVQSQVIGTKND